MRDSLIIYMIKFTFVQIYISIYNLKSKFVYVQESV